MREGYHDAVVNAMFTGEIKGTRAVSIRFEIPELGEFASKKYFLGDRIDNGGKTGVERFKDDLLTLLQIHLRKDVTEADLASTGWLVDPSQAVGIACNVKTRVRVDGDKQFLDVAFINARKVAPKWKDNRWDAVAAALRGAAPSLPKASVGKLAKPLPTMPHKPAAPGFGPEDEDLPF